MKTYKEQTDSILNKVNKKKKQRRIIVGAGVSLAATALALVLFLPYPTALPSVTAYKNSEYYSLIQKLNEITYVAPRYKNNFEKWTSGFGGVFAPSGGAMKDDFIYESESVPDQSIEGGLASPDSVGGNSNGAGKYEETTDNQVQGVTEADLLKRTDRYAFYLSPSYRTSEWDENGYYEIKNGFLLQVYSIAGENSAQVEEFLIGEDTGMKFASAPEMYLSKDATTLTVIADCYNGTYTQRYTLLVSVDTSDPTNLVETNRVYVSGNYISSRLVNGEILLFNSYQVSKPSFDDESTFLPQYGAFGNMQTVAAEDVVCSDIATTAKYTVVTKLDEKTLAVEDSLALLSYSQEAYVSATNVFLTQGYSIEAELGNGNVDSEVMTEISCVNYAGEGLELKGTFSVNGSVKNQYSMDEYENVLRVATTYTHTVSRQYTNGNHAWLSTVSRETNANLYCIDLTNFEAIAKVEKFAPEGETVESVRFNGTKAYVCTAVVITFSDPVFFFDLSDLQNITWTDTGTIDGYSTSLIDFGHGYLVGIGYNDKRQLKIEVYTQGEGKVESVCSYELSVSFSEEYKSYLIDRENGFIGLGVNGYGNGVYRRGYLLLQFEEGKLVRELFIPLELYPSNARAFYEGGYLYLFGEEFKAVNIIG